MKKNLTEIVFILDKSGSMSGLEKDTIGGFNSLIEKQKKEDGEALISTVLFSSYSEVITDRVPLDQIRPMTSDDYYVGGCTALLDAMGGAVHHIRNVHKYIREEDRPEKTLFIIMTDGQENSSRMYTYRKVKDMISKAQEELNWEFLFLGANMDAISAAESFGIHEDHAVRFENDAQGVEMNYAVLSEAVSCARMSMPLGKKWKKRIEKDYASRGKR